MQDLPTIWERAAQRAELAPEVLEKMAAEYERLGIHDKTKLIEMAKTGNKTAHACLVLIHHHLQAAGNPSALLSSYVSSSYLLSFVPTVAGKTKAETPMTSDPPKITTWLALSEPERKLEREPKMSGNTKAWESWVNGRIRTSQKAARDAIIGAVGYVLREERQKAAAEIAVLRQELSAIRQELAELRGEVKSKSALADIDARLARMEMTSSPRLKTVS